MNNQKNKLQDLDSDFQRVGRLTRKKIKISRDNLISVSIQNQPYFLSKKAIMEMDFFHEEGSGLGPTLEYYQCFSQAIQHPELHLWRPTDNHDLFPAPYSQFKSDTYQLSELFEFIGLLVARAILDGRILQIYISPVFWKLVFEKPLSA